MEPADELRNIDGFPGRARGFCRIPQPQPHLGRPAPEGLSAPPDLPEDIWANVEGDQLSPSLPFSSAASPASGFAASGSSAAVCSTA